MAMTGAIKMEVFRNLGLLFFFILVFPSLSGCGNGRPHQTVLSPEEEMKVNTRQYVATDPSTYIRCPKGWKIDNAHCGKTVTDRQVAFRGADSDHLDSLLTFSAWGNDAPLWMKEDGVERVSTHKHPEVFYMIAIYTDGDEYELLGSYMIKVFLKRPDISWEMSAGFCHPVVPDIKSAIEYIDCIDFVDEDNNKP